MNQATAARILRQHGADPDALICSEEEWQECYRRTQELCPLLPMGRWQRRDPRPGEAGHGQARWVCTLTGQKVILSAGTHEGRWWLHVSTSFPSRVPTYAELAAVKGTFIGNDRRALQVFAPASEHVNIHPYCLHLWACLEPEGDGLPNFGEGRTI